MTTCQSDVCLGHSAPSFALCAATKHPASIKSAAVMRQADENNWSSRILPAQQSNCRAEAGDICHARVEIDLKMAAGNHVRAELLRPSAKTFPACFKRHSEIRALHKCLFGNTHGTDNIDNTVFRWGRTCGEKDRHVGVSDCICA